MAMGAGDGEDSRWELEAHLFRFTAFETQLALPYNQRSNAPTDAVHPAAQFYRLARPTRYSVYRSRIFIYIYYIFYPLSNCIFLFITTI
jgi:hypothetical protein